MKRDTRSLIIKELRAGDYESAAYRLLDEITIKNQIIIDGPSRVWKYLLKYATKRQEHFICVTVNNKNCVMDHYVVSIGTVSETLVHPREIFRKAIIDGASSVILCHNHPSGVLTPSREDIEVTNRLVECGKLIGIKVLDHVIISKSSYLSMREERFISE